MKKQPIRSAQLVGQAGVGAMTVVKGGISVISAGLDAWFPESSSGSNNVGNSDLDASEFIIREPRLEERLNVKEFRQPPEHREIRRGRNIPNSGITIPVLRFPQWHNCSRCGLMENVPLTHMGRVFCHSCREKGYTFEITQIPFIAICNNGHLQDFPWSEWAHRDPHPECRGNLYYLRSGSGTLAGQRIRCECGAERSLLNIDKANLDATHLSFHLSKKGGVYTCRGHRPWLGETVDRQCSSYLRGNLRNAGNVFFAQTQSVICLPQKQVSRTADLLEFIGRSHVAGKISALKDLDGSNLIAVLRLFYGNDLSSFSDTEIEQALAHHEKVNSAQKSSKIEKISDLDVCSTGTFLESGTTVSNMSETEFRYQEYEYLREEQNSEILLSKRVDMTTTLSKLASVFSRIIQVHRLKEIRAYAGFSRIFSDNAPSLEDRKAMLRRQPVESNAVDAESNDFKNQPTDWLPATSSYGEGIYLELNPELLAEWEKANEQSLRQHFSPITNNAADSVRNLSTITSTDGGKGETDEKVTPRFVLIHTLGHVLIKQLAFECGYSASALRERLYFSEHKSARMNGLLIYTADGDSGGTLGGLVRLGTPEHLEKLLVRALQNARWCTSDPVCAEVGISQGQGPGNKNLAACYACCLLPETSCEEFNRYLDRAALVSLSNQALIGFFDFSSDAKS